jgi:hypothetical protein
MRGLPYKIILETHTDNLLQLAKTDALSVCNYVTARSCLKNSLKPKSLGRLEAPSFSTQLKIYHACLNQLMKCKEIIFIYSESQETNAIRGQNAIFIVISGGT